MQCAKYRLGALKIDVIRYNKSTPHCGHPSCNFKCQAVFPGLCVPFSEGGKSEKPIVHLCSWTRHDSFKDWSPAQAKGNGISFIKVIWISSFSRMNDDENWKTAKAFSNALGFKLCFYLPFSNSNSCLFCFSFFLKREIVWEYLGAFLWGCCNLYW